MRNIQIWLLLNRLQKECWKIEAKHPDHSDKEGHNFHGVVVESDFLKTVSKNKPQKQAKYADYLTLADKWIKSTVGEQKCTDCGEVRKIRLIRLNDDGLEYVGFLPFAEYFLNKYKKTWVSLILPMAGAFIVGVKIETIGEWIKAMLHFVGL